MVTTLLSYKILEHRLKINLMLFHSLNGIKYDSIRQVKWKKLLIIFCPCLNCNVKVGDCINWLTWEQTPFSVFNKNIELLEIAV